MRAALALARRGLGNVWPNPAVGCIIVSEGRVVGRGWTQPGGRPHAETQALAQAGARARGATVYVTLEPCAHHGQTPPCVEGLINAQVARVVVSLEDPDPRVSGRGFARLREAGVEVVVGIESEAAAGLNAGFILRVEQLRPLVTLKLATTLDGRIATKGRESQWITGAESRATAHALRAQHDALLVGSGTALDDNPDLTCRLPGLEGRSPIRVVLDGRLRLPLTSRLVATARQTPTWLLTLEESDPVRRKVYGSAGVEVIALPVGPDHTVDLRLALKALAVKGITRALVEGGAHLAAGLLRHGLVDRLVWFRSPTMMGGDGVPAAVGFGVEHLREMPGFTRVDVRFLGNDLMESYAKTETEA